jgi:hypothetical protein
MATLITASIHITATMVHIRNVERSPSITSTETRCVMDAATETAEVTKAEATKAEATEAEAIAKNRGHTQSKIGAVQAGQDRAAVLKPRETATLLRTLDE